ncbi:DUF2955 domain-containing protein [Falsiroseomonas oryziterrae]|uniref:DUF2955 domain-containing protein n=1 Tax=Falsiroseomonas oryziterrae TaxID=2911368 RepID=UPI001F437D5B|nr:DUF2955 domain-containing protein [Roseomonas sp. NPKOSM-4]
MPSDAREALRIALGFSGAFVFAEAADIQLTFIAPLVAGTLSAGAQPSLPVLAALPVIAWVAAFVAGIALQALHGMPLVLCIVLFGIFTAAFRLCENERLAPVGLIFLVLCAIIPDALIRAPDLAEDLARWCAANFLCASIAVGLAGLLLPPRGSAARPRLLEPPISAPVAAGVLLLAVVLTAGFQPPAPGAVLVGVVIALRPDRVPPRRVIGDRILAAFIGGAAAAIAWQAVWLAPDLAVFGTVTLALAWCIALRIVAPGAMRGVAMKSLNAFGILVGQGFSIFYDDTDERLWVRIAGVLIGVTYAAIALAVLRGIPRSVPAARPTSGGAA